MPLYLIQNSAAGTTTAPVKQPTGTAIRTMLQIKPGATTPLKIIEWGISFDGSAAATPGQVELFESDVAATMSTAAVAADITKYDGDALMGGDPTTDYISVGTTATGFATAAVTEGTTTTSRMFDLQMIAPTNQYIKQFPLGREPFLQVSKFCRVRVTFGATVNAYIYVIVAA